MNCSTSSNAMTMLAATKVSEDWEQQYGKLQDELLDIQQRYDDARRDKGQ